MVNYLLAVCAILYPSVRCVSMRIEIKWQNETRKKNGPRRRKAVNGLLTALKISSQCINRLWIFAAISILSFIVICIQHTSLLMKWNSFGRGHLLRNHNNQNGDIFHAVAHHITVVTNYRFPIDFDSKIIQTCLKSGYVPLKCVWNSLHEGRRRRPFKEKGHMIVNTMDSIKTNIQRFHVHDHIRCTMYNVHTAALEVNQLKFGKKKKRKTFSIGIMLSPHS